MLHPPAGLRVFLPPLGQLTLLLRRALADYDRRVFVGRVTLLGQGDQRGINQLAPTGLQAVVRSIRLKLGKEGLHDLGGSEGFAKQQYGVGIRDALIQTEPQETHEGPPISNLILDLLIRQIMDGL